MEPVFLSKIDFDDLGHVEATGEHLFEANGVEEAIIVARAGTLPLSGFPQSSFGFVVGSLVRINKVQ